MKSIIEKLGITPGHYEADTVCGIAISDKAVWCESSEMVQIKDNAVEMLVALIEWALQWEKQFEPSRLFEETVPIIEKATGKSWEEIKELYELHD